MQDSCTAGDNSEGSIFCVEDSNVLLWMNFNQNVPSELYYNLRLCAIIFSWGLKVKLRVVTINVDPD